MITLFFRIKNGKENSREISCMEEFLVYTFGALENSFKRNIDILAAKINNMSPVELFEEFYIKCVYDAIKEKTNQYAHEMKNKLNYNVTKCEVKTFKNF